LAQSGIRISHLTAPRHGFSSTRFGGVFINPLITGVERRYLVERILMSEMTMPTEVRVVAAMRRMRKQVLAGGIVSISALCNDWGPVVVPILAGTTRLAYGAPGLAHDTDAPVFPVFVVREQDGRLVVVIEAPLDLSKGGTAREAAIHATHQYAGILDQYIRRYPAQWRSWNHYVPDAHQT
jgi:lauroyl/myristoyl acyltransferase